MLLPAVQQDCGVPGMCCRDLACHPSIVGSCEKLSDLMRKLLLMYHACQCGRLARLQGRRVQSSCLHSITQTCPSIVNKTIAAVAV